MASNTDLYRALRSRHRSRAPLPAMAATFDDCVNQLRDIHAICLNLPNAVTDEDIEVVADTLSRLQTWGKDAGAVDPSLDRRLRLDSSLKERTLHQLTAADEMLRDAHDKLLQLQERVGEWDADHVKDETEDSIDPVAELQGKGRDEDSSVLDAVDEVISGIEDVGRRINILRSLGTSLQNPQHVDLKAYASDPSVASDFDQQSEVETLQLAFPLASPKLIKRMAHAAWLRRHYLKLMEKSRPASASRRKQKMHMGRPKQSARREMADYPFTFQQPEFGSYPPSKLKPSAKASTVAETEQMSSVFTCTRPPLTRQTTKTTVDSHSSGFKDEFANAFAEATAEPRPMEEVELPKPPMSADGKHEFVCQFCGFEVFLGSSSGGSSGEEASRKLESAWESAWEEHVFDDLMAFLCTWDDCSQAKRLYGLEKDWFKHELETHRIPRVWICGSCQGEFSSRDSLKGHLVDAHGDKFSEKGAAAVVAFLPPSFSRQPLGPRECPLCRVDLEADSAREHIAAHLKKYTLSTIAGDISTEEGDDDDDDDDDILSQSTDDRSDGQRKFEIMRKFANQQFDILADKGFRTLDVDGDENRFIGDSDDEDGDGDGDSAKNSSQNTRDWNVQRLLERTATSGPRPAQGRKPSSQDTPPSSTGPQRPILHTRKSPRNDEFTGREKDIAEMFKVLSTPGRVYVLSADGGMGKTTLAVEYTYRFEASYDYVFWVQAETKVGALETFNEIGLQLKLAPLGTDQKELALKTREFLEQTRDKRWLLIFDNVEKWDDIDDYCPHQTWLTNGSILITTRHASLTAPSRPVNYFRSQLKELDTHEGRMLLIQSLPPSLRPTEASLRDAEYTAAGDIAELAGLPLAILFVAGYMKSLNCPPSDFLKVWNEWRLSQIYPAGGGPKSLKVEDLMKIRLPDLSQDQLTVLRIMSFLDSDGVQRDLLEITDPKRNGPMCLKSKFRMVINDLVDKKFITQKIQDGRDVYTIHRTVQNLLITEMNEKPAERETIFQLTFDLVRFRLPRPSADTPEPWKWKSFKEFLPHVLSLQRAYSDPLSPATITPFLGLAELFRDGGVLLWQRYIAVDAMRLLVSAEDILNRIETVHLHLKAEIHTIINLLLQYRGISGRTDSREHLKKSLELRKRIVDEAGPGKANLMDRVSLIMAEADYANSYLEFHKYEEAEAIYEKCLRDFSSVLPEDGGGGKGKGDFTKLFAKLYHHMAYCKMYRGQFDEAIRLANKAVSLIGQMNDRLVALRYQYDLACVMLQSGDKEGALTLHESIYRERIISQGSSTYFTLQSQYAVGALHHLMGDLDAAEKFIKAALAKALDKGGRELWPEGAVARAKYHLSLVLREKEGGELTQDVKELAKDAKDMLSRLLVHDPISGVKKDDTLALFDHLQPVFGGRFTGLKLLPYVSKS